MIGSFFEGKRMTRKQIKRERQHEKDEKALADGSLTTDDIKERARIKRLINKGLLPRYAFVKNANGKLPRDKKGKLVFELTSTYNILTSKK
jgi:hypothetical protein